MRLEHRNVFFLGLYLLKVTFFELASQNSKTFQNEMKARRNFGYNVGKISGRATWDRELMNKRRAIDEKVDGMRLPLSEHLGKRYDDHYYNCIYKIR